MQNKNSVLAILMAVFTIGLIVGSVFHKDIQQFLYYSTPAVTADTIITDFSAADNWNRTFTGIARKVTPSVVTVTAEKGSRLSGVWEEWFRRHRKSAPEQLLGSGVIVRHDGYIITNEHVVREVKNLKVKLYDKRIFDADIVGTDPLTDIALLKIAADQLPAAVLGNSDILQPGEWVLAVGSPMNLHSTVTAGIISATGRSISIIGDEYGIEHFIQTDAAVNPGNSGGALVNLHGEVIGINTAIASKTGMYQGYGFAIPINLARYVTESLIASGKIERGFLGIQVQEISREYAQTIGLKREEGVLVLSVSENGPAAAAGIKTGDVLYKADGKKLMQPSDLQTHVAMKKPGESVTLMVFRDGREFSKTVSLQARIQ